METDTLLTRSECEQERSPQELDIWVATVFDRFSENDVTKNYLRNKKGLAKPFLEEILPRCNIGRCKFWTRNDITLKPTLGNQPYDAESIVRNSEGRHTVKVEIGNAVDGYSESLRMEYCATHGHVWMSGSVWREGTKASGEQVRVELEAQEHREMLKRQSNLVQRLAGDKLQKVYHSGTLLAIVFEDYIPFNIDTDSAAIEASMSHALLKDLFAKFDGLFLVGASGKFFREYGAVTL